MTRRAALVAIALLGSGGLGPARAQEVSFQEGTLGSPRADAAVRRILARADYLVLERDTILGPDAVVPGDLIVLGASVRLEGFVEGDVLVAQSDLFARPGARIGGRVVVIGVGGFYGSSLAELEAPPIEAAHLAYQVRRVGLGRYLIVGPRPAAGLRLPGVYGLLLPSYDRVNAVTLAWGLGSEPGRRGWVPRGSARIRFRTARERLDGELGLEWSAARSRVRLAGGRTVRSNEGWITTEAINSLGSLVSAVDVRNYYDARFVELAGRLAHGERLTWSHGVTVGFERAESLRNRDPFSFAEDRLGFQANFPIDEGDIWSVRLETRARLEAVTRTRLEVVLGLDLADRDVAGDFTYSLLELAARLHLPTLARQALVVRVRGQAVLSDDPAPRQRWRGLGGLYTLPTLDRLGRFGDRMGWLEATYFLPPPLAVPVAGPLRPWVRYAVGNAWVTGSDRPSTIHNPGLGVTLGYLSLGLYTDPDDDFATVVMLGLQWPGVPAP